METKHIEAKLLIIQEKVGAIKKDKTNPHFKNTYFDINSLLEVVKPLLNEQKIVLLQPLSGGNMKTILFDTETQEVFESEVLLPVNPDPQKMGAIISYFRRYSLTSMLALEAEDTDANDTAPMHPNPVAQVTAHIKRDTPFVDKPGDVPAQYTCPVDGEVMVQKEGKYGTFYSCKNYPTCKGTRNRFGEDKTK